MKKGFTLVEMLVVLGVISIVAGIGLANLRNRNKDERVVESAENLRQAFLQAKSQAQSGKKNCAACGAAGGVCGAGDSSLLGWRVTLYAAPVSYEIKGECGNVLAPTPTPFFPGGVKYLPVGVTLTTGGGNTMVFRGGGLGTDLTAPMTVTVSASGITRAFTVQVNGEIGPIHE